MKTKNIFLRIVFFVESHLKLIKWSNLGQNGPKLHKTSKIKNKIAKKIELPSLFMKIYEKFA